MRKQNKRKAGRLTTNNVVMETHEYVTINTLLVDGNDVEMLRKTRTPHSKSADIMMHGMVLELKSPTGDKLRTFDRIIHRAIHQSQNIVIDLRRTKMADNIAVPLLAKMFWQMRSMRNLWIIEKNDRIMKFKK